MSSAFWNFFDCSTQRKTTLPCLVTSRLLVCGRTFRLVPGPNFELSVYHVYTIHSGNLNKSVFINTCCFLVLMRWHIFATFGHNFWS